MLTRKIASSIVRRNVATATYAHLGRTRMPDIKNEPCYHYAPGSAERAKLTSAIDKLYNSEPVDIPCVINGEEHFTGDVELQVMPSNHKKVLARVHIANRDLINKAVDGALEAKHAWETLPLEERAAVFLKAAELLSTKYRYSALAATMLGQAKTPWQAEIDAAAETADFWRFNSKFAAEIYDTQPPMNPTHSWNRLEYRALEGFVVAISPFNFTAIGANLCAAPALMGNTVLWKPSHAAVLSNYMMYKIMKEAGLPDGVIQWVPSHGPDMGETALMNRHLAGLHFTGSTATFSHLWKQIGENIKNYVSYPRLVGETGGKNFHLAHPSADVESFVLHTLRAAFEFSGQKCSACSRAYVPDTMWDQFKSRLTEEMGKLKIGQPHDFSSFTSAVIDAKSFNKIKGYIDRAKNDPSCTIIAGGTYDDSQGYFIQPTAIQVTNPTYESMTEEIFGPVLSIYVYKAAEFDQIMEHLSNSTPYALTGALFAQDRLVIAHATEKLRNAAGNFYINDKSTGAIVGQQPFGGARASGTNDKAGAGQNLMRWVSVRTVKENFAPISHWGYPHMEKE